MGEILVADNTYLDIISKSYENERTVWEDVNHWSPALETLDISSYKVLICNI